MEPPAEALADHKHQGNPIAVWRNGKVVWIHREKSSCQKFKRMQKLIDRSMPSYQPLTAVKATVLVKVRFLDKERRMLPDMSAKVSFLPRRLTSEETKPRLAAGRSALIDRDGRTFVYLLERHLDRETPVRVKNIAS